MRQQKEEVYYATKEGETEEGKRCTMSQKKERGVLCHREGQNCTMKQKKERGVLCDREEKRCTM